MVKTKNQKSKPTRQVKQSHSKKRGKENDISEFRAQLDVLGLKIIQVTADGNCFFRALADQLEGDEDEYNKYRCMVVEFIRNNREKFEPFIEDEVPFDEYCKSMGEDGTWAGHMELQAASLVTHTNICIHRHMSPRWYVQNFDKREARMIHLSYHDGEHYNSVRSKDDTCSGPARPFVIKADADLSVTSNQAKGNATKSQREAGAKTIQEESIKMVKAGSGCEDARKIEQVLLHVGGDVDAAIEFLIAEQGPDDHIVDNYKISCPIENSCADHRDEDCEQNKLKIDDSESKRFLPCNDMEEENSSQHDEKKIPRNKPCPCGSKKKYKSCCGTVSAKSSARIAVNRTVEHGKSRKDRKQVRKGGSNALNSIQSDGGPPDMGALCI
ncbi:OTU domain-containing protein 3 isoform X2 [Olea europaea var. sylvestris]|uniref:OTU domain-containing protein 3 isoform X2 n=1 Tax=Olea europaea var. sylvestris TaxID=158386 RepID=UPI000C1D01FE|nr:OTU domain-containing protein 3 isoform X2 [Olea europaea var. sylvestris]